MSAPAEGAHLRRRLGLGLLTLYGVGVMVGAGIYVLTGAVAGEAGTWAPLAFLLAGLVAAPTAITYAELSARVPEAGGVVAYLRHAFGAPWLSLIAGLLIVGAGLVSASAVLQGGVGYLGALIDVPRETLIVVIGGALVAVAVIGVLESMATVAIFTLIEVGGLLFVAWAGLTGDTSADWAAGSDGPHLGGLAAAALLAFFAYTGFEDMVNLAEETRAPRRTMPRAIFLAVAATSALYMLVSFAAVRAVGPEALAASDRPLALVVERAMGFGAGALALIAVFAALNGVLAQIVMGARVIYGARRSAAWLGPIAAVHPRFGTPARATLLLGAIMLGLALTVSLTALAAATSTILLVVFCAMNVALIKLKRGGPPPEGGFEAPAWMPWAGLFAAAAALLSPWLTPWLI